MITEKDVELLKIISNSLQKDQPNNTRYFQYGCINGVDNVFKNVKEAVITSDTDCSSFHLIFADILGELESGESVELRDGVIAKLINRFHYRDSITAKEMEFNIENIINFILNSYFNFRQKVENQKQLIETN